MGVSILATQFLLQLMFLENLSARIQDHVLAYSDNLINLLIRLAYAFIATVIFRISLKVLHRYHTRAYRQICRLQRRFLPSIRIQNIELVNAQSMSNGLMLTARFLYFSLLALLTYIYIPFLLNITPWTQKIGDLIFKSLISGVAQVSLNIIGYAPNFIFILIIATAAYCLIQISNKVLNEVGKGNISFPGFYREWAKPTSNLLNFAIIAFAAVLAFPYLPGGNSPALQGISIFVGILISLGSTTVIGNLVSGVVLIYTRAFTKGDRVTIGSVTGDVVEETLLVTRIRTTKNRVVTIPNGMVLGSYIVNFSDHGKTSLSRPLIVHTTITLGYDVPWRNVHEILIAAAKATQDVLAEPPPFVLQTALNDFYVSYQINVYTEQSLKLEVIESELHQNIQDYCNKSSVEILSPHYVALRHGNSTTIPSQYVSPNYRPQNFQVEIVDPDAKSP